MAHVYGYKYSTERLERILNLATSGQSGVRIAEDEDADLSYVYDRLRSAGIKPSNKQLSGEKEAEIRKVCKLLEQPTVNDIVGLVGVSYETARKYMLEDGYKVRGVGKPPLLESIRIKIIEMHKSNPYCSFSEVAHAVKETQSTVYKVLRDYGCKSNYEGRWPKIRVKTPNKLFN
jgi:hypothetical protein